MNKQTLGYIYLVTTFFIWGSLYVVSKYALSDIPPITLQLFRCVISVAVLYFFVRREPVQKIARCHYKYFLLIGAVGYAFSVALQLVGTKLLNASLASLINAINPIAITLMAAIFLSETLSRQKIISIIISICGVWCIIGDTGNDALNAGGIISSLLSVLFWSAASIAVRKLSAHYSAFKITYISMAVAVVFTLPASLLELMYQPITIHPASLAAVLYMGIVCTAVSHTLWNKSLSLIDAGTCSMLYPLQPFTSALLGIILLGETITTNYIIGSIIISLGIILSFLKLPAVLRTEEN